jgi:hypothetical protein
MSNSPLQFPIVHKNVRRALLRRFPYSLFFAMDSDQRRLQVVLGGALVFTASILIGQS